MKTKTVTVYWSEIVHMKNTIEVPEDWTKHNIIFDPAETMYNGARNYNREIGANSIEVVEVEDEE